MKNTQNFKVKELTVQEINETQGGFWGIPWFGPGNGLSIWNGFLTDDEILDYTPPNMEA